MSQIEIASASKMSIRCYALPYEIRGGAANMALDQALLECAAGLQDAAFLRTYGWREPTLSLGYFQRLGEALAQPGWQGVSIVRRPTGGGALWHDQELTYAVVLPTSHEFARPGSALYRSVHGAILEILQDSGVDSHRRADVEIVLGRRAKRFADQPFLCFTDRDSEDIVTEGIKVAGSAQRRHAGAILQHGSLLLKHSERTPEILGVCDLATVSQDPGTWSELLVPALARALKLTLAEEDFPVAVRRRAADLETSVYGSSSWTGRR
jgi:lipoate-protein ligase A